MYQEAQPVQDLLADCNTGCLSGLMGTVLILHVTICAIAGFDSNRVVHGGGYPQSRAEKTLLASYLWWERRSLGVGTLIRSRIHVNH